MPEVSTQTKNTQAATETTTKTENAWPSFSCYGGDKYCNGQMSKKEVVSAMASAFNTIRSYDKNLAQNLTRDGVQICFLPENGKALVYFSTENVQVTDNFRKKLWDEIPEKERSLRKDEYNKKVPFILELPEGYDGVTVTPCVPAGHSVSSLGSAVLISDKHFYVPDEFKEDPIHKQAYAFANMLALTAHEGYHLAQAAHIKQGGTMSTEAYAKAISDKAAVESDAYYREVQFLNRVLKGYEQKSGESAEAKQEALKYILDRDKRMLEYWIKRSNKLTINNLPSVNRSSLYEEMRDRTVSAV